MNKPVNQKPKKKLSKSAIVLIVSCVIIAIPVIVFLVIIISASINTGKPIIGNRFDNDLTPSISSSQVKDVEESIKSLSGVEDCEAVLKTANFRVNVDGNDNMSEEEAIALAKEVYSKVDEILPVSTYFKMSSDGEKMYDLSVTVYNYIPDTTEDEKWVSCVYYKNSNMAEPMEEWLSKAVDEKLAERLRNGEASSDVNEDVQESESGETSE